MSKYKQKKKFKTLPTLTRKRVFVYTSTCCKAVAKKPPVERSAEDRAAGEFSKCGLGTWRCGSCEQKTKVTRSKKEETQEAHGASTDTTASA